MLNLVSLLGQGNEVSLYFVFAAPLRSKDLCLSFLVTAAAAVIAFYVAAGRYLQVLCANNSWRRPLLSKKQVWIVALLVDGASEACASHCFMF